MVQAIPVRLTVEEFIARYGDNDRYELIDGELTDREPTGLHEQVAAFLLRKVNVQIDQNSDLATWFTPTRCLINPLGSDIAFRPDVIVLDRSKLNAEPLWQREPIITSGAPVKLVIEVVSTNWQNDYARKVEDYAALGIPEYWVSDYLGVGGKLFLGDPKQPTFSVYTLNNRAYSVQRFKMGDPCGICEAARIVSPTFPLLDLMVDQVFAAGQ
jgi:Uma2 family endonuclease